MFFKCANSKLSNRLQKKNYLYTKLHCDLLKSEATILYNLAVRPPKLLYEFTIFTSSIYIGISSAPIKDKRLKLLVNIPIIKEHN